MEEDYDVMRSLRREAIRTILESFQGYAIGRQADATPKEDTPPKGVRERLNIAYINRQEVPLAMDVFKPDVDDDVDLPVIITIHGGGLVVGDRRMSRSFARELASRGYLVFSIEYRLAPRANVCEQLDDICAGMDLIGRHMIDLNVDYSRIFLTAESAGAYLAVYVAAMKNSLKLQEAIGHKPTSMSFKALGLISGMFYTDKPDPIGELFSDQFYGEKRADKNFLRYMDPEHRELVNNLPPCFFVTSQGDFLNDYTLEYHRALKRAGKKTHLLYYGAADLGHAFVTTNSDLEESQDAITKMCSWFEEQAQEHSNRVIASREDAVRLEKLSSRIASGEIVRQKSWQFVRELNSVTENRLDAIAIQDDNRNYSYRQLFSEWDRYAEVFSALGIGEQSGSRVGVTATISAQPIVAFYALNMVGASVSMLHHSEVLVEKWIRRAIKTEGITDLLISDFCVNEELLCSIVRLKKSLGLRHVIVFRASKGRVYETPADKERAKRNYHELKRVKGALFMQDLLRTHEGTPIVYGSGANDQAAVVVHTSGTTKGVRKPIPLSDHGLNAAAVRFLDNELFDPLVGKAVTALLVAPHSSYTMVDMVHLPLSMSAAIALPHGNMDLGMNNDEDKVAQFVSDQGVNVLLSFPYIAERWPHNPILDSLDLSSLEVVIMGGGPVSLDQLRRLRKALRKAGADPVIVNGYGISECGGATIMHVYEGEGKSGRSEIGLPLKGVNVLVQDEATEEFHTLDEGPRVGILHVSSETNSCGRLGDKVFFEQVDVNGAPYICTNDLVQVNDSGTLTHIGRANRYFVDDAGARFESGVVEEAIASQPGIEACAIVPAFDRMATHDTVPLLFVKVQKNRKGRKRRETVRKAMLNAYTKDGSVRGNRLPWRCVICDELPTNDAGKVDATRILIDEPKGDTYKVRARIQDGELRDIAFVRVRGDSEQFDFVTPEGVSKKYRREQQTMMRRLLEVYGIHGIPTQLAEDMMRDNMGPQVYSRFGGSEGIPNCLALWLTFGQPEPASKKGSRMGKKNKKRPMPMGFGPKAPFGPMPFMGMPMMEMGAAFGPGPKGHKRPKGKKKGPKGPFGPMPPRHRPFGM